MPTQRTQASAATACHLIKELYQSEVPVYWNANAPKRYRKLDIRILESPPQELRIMTRKNLGTHLVARFSNSNFAVYHQRFSHIDANNMCSCGQDWSVEYIFFCRRLRYKRAPGPSPSTGLGNIKRILGKTKWAKAFEKWYIEVNPYEVQ